MNPTTGAREWANYLHWQQQPRHIPIPCLTVLILPTLLGVVWGWCRVQNGSRQRIVATWRDIIWWSLQQCLERKENKCIEHELTRHPFNNGYTHINILIKGVCHVEERFACILFMTCCIQGLTKALSDCDVKIIKFPSKHLSDMMVSNSNTDLLRNLPMRPPKAVIPKNLVVAHVHA